VSYCDLTSPDATCPRCGFVSKVRGAIRQCRKPAPRLCGPGCHLTRAIAWFGVRDDGKCGCGEHAAQMDAWGPDECERQIETIMGWLRDAAAKRFPLVPWVDAPVRMLVMECIAAARRDATPAPGDDRPA
jgi:hypothetical protein